jgi:HD superfamily phosphohydrolase
VTPESRSSTNRKLFDDTESDQARVDPLIEFLKPKKTIQLAASGPVMITELERAIIDTRSFQRLRGVRQLGAAYLVYPTALHTRFDHSLGTLQMVAEMIRLIRSNLHSEAADQKVITTEQEIVARLYALLHDITHVPFGHTIEDELQILDRHDENDGRIQRFLGIKSEIGSIIVQRLGSEFQQRLLEVYRWDDKKASRFPLDPDWVFVHDLVSNTVCADLLDYIRRDDFYCNLGIGMRYQFLNYLYLDRERGQDDDDPQPRQRRVFVRVSKGQGIPRRDILSDLCRLMEARYMIAERVYFHHAKIVAGTMIGRAIQEHVAETFAGDKEKAENWICGVSDDELMADLRNSKSQIASRLGDDIASRRLYRTVGSFTEAHTEAAQSLNRDISIEKDLRQQLIDNADQRRSIENELADVVLAAPGDVLVYAPPANMNLKIARMRVLWNGEHRTFKKIDDPIVHTRLNAVEEAHRKLWCVRLIASRNLSGDQISRLNRYFSARFFEPDSRASKNGTDRVLREVIEEFMVRENVPQPTNPADRKSKLEAVLTEVGAQFHGGKGTFGDRLRAAVRTNFDWSS